MLEIRILFSSNVFQSFPFAWLLELRNILKKKKKKNHEQTFDLPKVKAAF